VSLENPPLPADLLPDPKRLREVISLHDDRANDLRKLLRLVLKLKGPKQPLNADGRPANAS
jgi:hypothetical protein